MITALNSAFRRRRRSVAMAAVVLGLAGDVVLAHDVMSHGHASAVVVMCVAIAETAAVAAGVLLASNPRASGLRWFALPLLHAAPAAFVPLVRGTARAGPLLQVFRL